MTLPPQLRSAPLGKDPAERYLGLQLQISVSIGHGSLGPKATMPSPTFPLVPQPC